MKHSITLAALIAAASALGVVAIAHGQPPGHGAPAVHAAHVTPPAKDDPHVAKLYELVKAAHAPGATVDHEKAMGEVKALARAYAAETKQDPAAMEEHVMQMLHQVMMAAQGHPEKIATLDAFWTTLHEAGAAAHH